MNSNKGTRGLMVIIGIMGGLVVAGVIFCLAIGGSHQGPIQMPMQPALVQDAPAAAPSASTGHMHFNPNAQLDASQVIDLRPGHTIHPVQP